ncbi:MAG TPA: GntG family PLP-dependent aldolase [Pirellulales bacterium]|jgi:threonine aldolase|nr:GntG family PLP-dependent aldolase [Pirellulales bacterium]
MNAPVVDLRSDTVSRPTPEMRAAMASAAVGDDVFEDDPTVNRLQERVAALLGKEAALFMPSGSMSNQIAVRIHCRPGDEFLCEAGCHIYNYEQAAHVQLSGVSAHVLQGEFGILKPAQFEGMIRPENDHLVRTRLVCLENTHNRGAGRIQPRADVEAICRWAHAGGLSTHLDGARLMNAVVATGISAREWASPFDTVSLCFSKGLGAPVGSALAGPRDLIRQARRARKLFGGAMRQVGILAAAADYALEHHVARLAEDHAHAQRLGEAIRAVPGLTLCPGTIDTNIVIFRVEPELGTGLDVLQKLESQNVWMLKTAPQMIRAVTHLDVSAAAIDRAVEAIGSLRRR